MYSYTTANAKRRIIKHPLSIAGVLGLVAYSPRRGEYHSVVAVETGDKRQSTGLSHLNVQVLRHAEKDQHRKVLVFFWQITIIRIQNRNSHFAVNPLV